MQARYASPYDQHVYARPYILQHSSEHGAEDLKTDRHRVILRCRHMGCPPLPR